MNFPILYSFRRCPYAIRARVALLHAKRDVVLREILLRDKPHDMLKLSPKGTVPVLHLPTGVVLEESLDVMLWAIDDPEDVMRRSWEEQKVWIEQNDGEFKRWLDRYKYAVRYPEEDATTYRDRAMNHLRAMEEALQKTGGFLLDLDPALVDFALFPFVRQFKFVNTSWFEGDANLPLVNQWLDHWLGSSLFEKVMQKHQPWKPGDEVVWFRAPQTSGQT